LAAPSLNQDISNFRDAHRHPFTDIHAVQIPTLVKFQATQSLRNSTKSSLFIKYPVTI
jgi:hypothetical protein